MPRPRNERQIPVPAPVEQVSGLPVIISAPAPQLRRSKRIEERQQREAAQQARRVEEPREDAENHEVDWQAIVLQELLAEEEEEQRKETNYEDMAEKFLAE